MQTTLRRPAPFSGTGLHTGRPARLRVCPAPADHGIRFRRTDLGVEIPALWTHAQDARLCTRIADGPASVQTIEHLMAALSGCGIHNARVDIDGPEVPILDGSAAPFVEGLLAAGRVTLPAPLRAIRLLRPVAVAEGDAEARFDPAPHLVIDFAIDFPDDAIGKQSRTLDIVNGTFVDDLSDSRTFCRLRDVETMRARGLALGGTFENAVVVDGPRVLTPGGLRSPDEPVRHKMLDALGDLALAGAPLLARYTGRRAGHALTGALLRRLFATPDAWEWAALRPADAARLPGGRGLAAAARRREPRRVPA